MTVYSHVPTQNNYTMSLFVSLDFWTRIFFFSKPLKSKLDLSLKILCEYCLKVLPVFKLKCELLKTSEAGYQMAFATCHPSLAKAFWCLHRKFDIL